MLTYFIGLISGIILLAIGFIAYVYWEDRFSTIGKGPKPHTRNNEE